MYSKELPFTLPCIHTVEPLFQPSTLVIPTEIASSLGHAHISFMQREFPGIDIK